MQRKQCKAIQGAFPVGQGFACSALLCAWHGRAWTLLPLACLFSRTLPPEALRDCIEPACVAHIWQPTNKLCLAIYLVLYILHDVVAN